MDEKKSIDIGLGTVVCIFIIIVLVIGIAIMYVQNDKRVKELETQKTILESQKDALEEKLSTIQVSNEKIINELNKQANLTSSENEIKDKLADNSLLLVNNAIKNNDGTYTLKGEIITVDKSKEQTTEFPPYKKTGENRQITIASNTKCTYVKDNDETATDTVENVFSKKLYLGTGMGACFNFNFENGKCTSIFEVVTGH